MKEYKKPENEKQTYTAGEVVEFTINLLSGIMIPAGLAETVGVPIAKAIGNLEALKAVLEAQQAPESEKEVRKDEREADLK